MLKKTLENTYEQIAHAELMSDFYKEVDLGAGVDSAKRTEWALKAQQLRDGQIQNIKFINWALKRK